jgi:hypothetical protein
MAKRFGEIPSCLEIDTKEAVRLNADGDAFEAFPAMDRSIYDSNNDGIVDTARQVIITCRNATGSTITKGSIVYVTGATGNHPTIALADKDSEATSSKTLGMVTADIAHNADGTVAVNGTVDNLNTDAYTAGTALWLGDNGGWVSTAPSAPAHSVFIGWVTNQNSSNGRIVLHIQNGYELEELHDVSITDPDDGDVLTFDEDLGLWVNAPATGGGGNAFGTISVSGQSDVVADASNDTLTLVAGSNVIITTNATTDAITISATGTGGASDEFDFGTFASPVEFTLDMGTF